MKTMTTSCGRVRKMSTKTTIAMSAGFQRMARTIASARPVPMPTKIVSRATSAVTQKPPSTDGPYWARMFRLKKFSRSEFKVGSVALQLVRRRIVALEARRTVAREDGADRRARIDLRAVPFLVELHERAVLLHAFDRHLDGVAIAVVEPEGVAEVAAVEVLEADLDRLVLAGGVDRGRNLVQRGEGALGDHRLHRIGEGVVALHLEAVLLGVLRRPGVGDGAAVDRELLALQILE